MEMYLRSRSEYCCVEVETGQDGDVFTFEIGILLC